MIMCQAMRQTYSTRFDFIKQYEYKKFFNNTLYLVNVSKWGMQMYANGKKNQVRLHQALCI